jgi:3-dehydroquinate dehydratase-2
MQILVLNGVNLDMLAHRDPALYGGLSLDELETQIYAWAHELELTARCLHTNHEGQFVEWIHDAHGRSDGVIVNPGAWTHYSYAIHDALEILDIPIVEVHLSNILERKEEWRRVSVLEPVVAHRVLGQGPEGYREALGFFAAQRAESE